MNAIPDSAPDAVGSTCFAEACRYVEELGWWLVPLRGPGPKPKAPYHDGWPDFRPDVAALTAILARRPGAGVGVNLGGSGLVDVESDSDEGECVLADLCRGVECPRWRSRRGVHRLFRARPDVEHRDLRRTHGVAVEFRAGRHQSALPPSVIGEVRYEWDATPFDVPPPPMPDRLLAFYLDHPPRTPDTRTTTRSAGEPREPARPYRDHYDYLLRHFDLMAELTDAGVEFVCARPDTNGNVPCHVPAVLRGGKEDTHPSGVLNVFNGRLRDFATGTNHLYFQTVAALTGRHWTAVLREYERRSGTRKGRPVSVRISPPAPPSQEGRVSVEEARSALAAYLGEQLARDPIPGRVNLIRVPQGIGKTYSMCQLLAKFAKKATVLTLENALVATHERWVREAGGSVARMPVLDEYAECPHPAAYKATSRRGFRPSQSDPCRSCAIGPKRCGYLTAFTSLDAADVLCGAAVYHTHPDFYAGYGNPARPLLVLDENPLDVLLAPAAHPLSDWQGWAGMVRHWSDKAGRHRAHADPLLALVGWLERVGGQLLDARDPDDEPVKFALHAVPDDLRVPGLARSATLGKWLNHNAGRKEHRGVRNLCDAALYLLTTADAHVVIERKGDAAVVRFRRRNPLPPDKEVFILDATAKEELLRAALPGWDVRVWDCPPVEQRGRVVRVMDHDPSRNWIRRQAEAHRPHNPAWLVQVLDHILKTHGPMPVIGPKEFTRNPRTEHDILGMLRHADRIAARFHFPCRGHTFADRCLMVFGTPYKDQAAVWELALAVWGPDGLPVTEYERQPRTDGEFATANMGYADERLGLIQEFFVAAELSQAVGRVRPFQNDCTVLVVSNAPLPGWQAEQYAACELFDLRLPLRRDAADAYCRYAEVTDTLLAGGGWVTNPQVCREMGMPPRTGQAYMARYREDHASELEVVGHRVRRVASTEATNTRTSGRVPLPVLT